MAEAVKDAEVRGIVAAGFRKFDADFEARLQLAADAGELREGADPEAFAMLATATMHTMAVRARAGASRPDLRKIALNAVGVICG